MTVGTGSASGLDARVRLRRGGLDLEASLRVEAGETVALVGPNGAGKSTLLRAVAGLERLDAGRVVLDGCVLDDVGAGTSVPPEQRPVGMVFQDHLLFPHLSVLENVAFGLRSRGRPRAEARRRALGWLAKVGLEHRAGDRPAGLSGGEAQRVALARALAPGPRLLLLDEPLAALDVATRVEVRRQLRLQLAAFGGVWLLVTHDPLEAMALADRLVVLEAGRVVQSGSAADLGARPRSAYVAELVGVNLFAGVADGVRVTLDGGGVLVVAEAASGPVLAVAHPRAVALHRRRPEGTPRNMWSGRVRSVDHEGGRARVRIGGPIPVLSEITAAAATELGLAPGADVWVSLKASEVAVHPA